MAHRIHTVGLVWVDEKDERDNGQQHYVQRYVYRALRSDEDGARRTSHRSQLHTTGERLMTVHFVL